MNLKHLMMIGLLSTASLVAFTPTASADQYACNNYGVQVGVWVDGGNCSNQQCYMGAGAASGAGSGGVGGDDDTGAEATAGTNCDQGGSDDEIGGIGFTCLETTSIATPENQYQVTFHRRC